jgi:hypothetical protein
VFTALLDGADERQVTDGNTCCAAGPFGGPVFLNDGRTIVYDDYNAIYAIADGKARQTVVRPTTGEQSRPTLSYDGTGIALQATCAGDNGARSIWAVPATAIGLIEDFTCASGDLRRYSPPGTDATHPAWGPNMFVWSSVPGGTNHTSPVPSSLGYWYDFSFGMLTSGSGDDRNPSFSPFDAVIGAW